MNVKSPRLNSADSNRKHLSWTVRERYPLAPPKALPMLAASWIWLTPATADAYMGPGAGLSALGSLLALLGAALLVIVGFVWYPVKRLMAKQKAAHADQEEDAEQETVEAESSAQQ